MTGRIKDTRAKTNANGILSKLVTVPTHSAWLVPRGATTSLGSSDTMLKDRAVTKRKAA
jgi:hypothetical protein